MRIGFLDAYVKGGQKVGGPSDDVLEFQVGQGTVTVDVALLQDFLADSRDLLVGQTAANQLTTRVLQVVHAHHTVFVEVWQKRKIF